MHDFLIEALILTGASTLIVTICHYIKVPTIVGFILTGVLVGPSGFSFISKLPDINVLTEIAAVFLMFMIGLEFSLPALRHLRDPVFKVGSLQVLLTVLIVFLLGTTFFGMGQSRALLWGFVISLSSTALVLKILYKNREVQSTRGQSSIGILLFQDFAVIPMMAIIPLLAYSGASNFSFNGSEIWFWLGKIILLALIIFALAKFILSQVLDKIVGTQSQEVFFFAVVFLCIGIGFLFDITGLSLSLGAFVAGILLAGTPFVYQTQSVFLNLRDSFLGIFFATIGMLLDIRFIYDNLQTVILISFAFFLIKFGCIFAAMYLNRYPIRSAVVTALSLSQVGEFSLILASGGVEVGIFDFTDHQYFLAVSIFSMIAAPFLYKLAPKVAYTSPEAIWKSFRVSKNLRKNIATTIEPSQTKTTSENSEKRPHTIIIGFGIAGMNVHWALKSLGIPTKVIEMNLNTVKKFKAKGIDIIYGDASHVAVLEHAGIMTAKSVVITISGQEIAPFIIDAIRKLRIDIPIVLRVQYIREVGKLNDDASISVVVAETETVAELISTTFRSYGLESKNISNLVDQVRSHLKTNTPNSPLNLKNKFTLPGWKSSASISPFVIHEKSYAAGKPLRDLNQKLDEKGSIVSVFRKGFGMTASRSDILVQENDVLHIILSLDDCEVVENFLNSGSFLNESNVRS